MTGALAQASALCDLAAGLVAGTAWAPAVEDLRARLHGPLRLALAGRVKAGKSTLLNTLVGERLAATDAGECTRVVTWYRRGDSYEVRAVGPTGEASDLSFRRVDGSLLIDLDGLATEELTRIEVAWPARALDSVTLIDTPGLASLDDSNSMRTVDFFALEQDRPGDADAVIYLMRHLHRRDAEFLGAFLDRSVAGASPVNAVAVLSRADEVGACRPDAMESARRIANRYQENPEVRALCTTVVPVAALLAETGLTLREEEAAALRAIASTPDEVLEPMLWSADGFCDPPSSDVTVELRRSLLLRLGMYGLSLATAEIRAGNVTTATELSRLLVEASGLAELRSLIDGLFMPRAQLLKARSTLAGLRGLARSISSVDAGAAGRIESEVERVEVSTPEFAQLRLVHLVRSGAVGFSPDEVEELDRITAPGSTARRLGCDDGAGGDALRGSALSAVERWRSRGAGPLNDPAMTEACESMARTYEALYVEVAAPPA